MPEKKSQPASKKSANSNSASNNEKLKEFIRGHANDFLSDKNISSIGIGYKQRVGKPTREIAHQFTVDKKVVPGLLESVDTQ
jgi:endonuclease G, mitochondrial